MPPPLRVAAEKLDALLVLTEDEAENMVEY